MPARTRPRDERVFQALEGIRATCDVDARRASDPVSFVHRYDDTLDKELVALLAASVAFGNVKAIRMKLDDALERIGPRPSLAADDERTLFKRLDGWIHRVYRGEDIARLLLGARRLQVAHGSLGARFARDLATHVDLREALATFCDALRHEGGFPLGAASNNGAPMRRGPGHLLPDPRGASGSKRLFLFLRWMVRPADGVDLGLWDVSPALLLCPVDTHIHKLAKNLGFTSRNDLSWRTTEEITRALATFDADDPVKYDFALCHMGMLQRCPSRRDPKKCEGCGVRSVCRHWRHNAKARSGASSRVPRRALPLIEG